MAAFGGPGHSGAPLAELLLSTYLRIHNTHCCYKTSNSYLETSHRAAGRDGTAVAERWRQEQADQAGIWSYGAAGPARGTTAHPLGLCKPGPLASYVDGVSWRQTFQKASG